MKQTESLPLTGIRVLEFSHMVMGPSCGMILADMGAEVIKVEPVGSGDKTRHLKSFGAGFHCTFNRNKKSLAIDIKSPEGRKIILELVKTADVVTENFREGTLERQGLGYAELKKLNPKLVYCSMKGFLAGPYKHRAALDEVVQMMGGLAYMTGPPGRPSRAGASVNDIMGGMFGVIGILGALLERQRTDNGCLVKSGLFENCALLMAQHIASFQRTGQPSESLFTRHTQPWPVYDMFDSKDDNQVFVALVSDGQWRRFCETFGLHELISDPELADNQARVSARGRILPLLAEIFASMTVDEALRRLDAVGCPYAPVHKPEDLLRDQHLQESGALLDVEIENGKTGRLPGLPLEYNERRFDIRRQPPLVGEHSRELVRSLGRSSAEIDALVEGGVLTGTRREAAAKRHDPANA